MSASKKPARRLTRPRRPNRRLRGCLLPLLIGSILLAVVGGLVLTVVSVRVAARFEARERESPTRIYGRIHMLRPRAAMPPREIVARLQALGYRQARSEPESPGEFSTGRALTVHLRGFPVPGGETTPRIVRIRHRGDRISEVEDLQTGAEVEALLEPEVLTTLYGPMQEDRTVLTLGQFPRDLVDAVLATEDRSFYRHFGIDPVGLARATLANFGSGSIKQGGSTLTQQLAKNLFFDQERTLTRKASEAVVALVLEARYSKDRILQAYLNEVYLGQQRGVSIRGFAQAAAFYFDKEVQDLDLADVAMLAGLTPAPGRYNPFLYPQRAIQRRNLVLSAMEEAGVITAVQREAAEKRPLGVRKSRRETPSSRGILYLADYVRQMIGEGAVGDFSRAGMRVFTTIDPLLQRHAQEALARGLESLESRFPSTRRRSGEEKLQGAMVVLDQRSGSVLDIVGGRDYAASQFNRVTQARRQPGSLFKPFVYLAGYEQAAATGWHEEVFTPATRLMDEPLRLRVGGMVWEPVNYDGDFRGVVTAQIALERSLNVPTVRAAQTIGLDQVVSVASAAGIESPLRSFPSLALGAQEVTPLEMAAAYATIANEGIHNRPAMVEGVENGDGTLSFARETGPQRVLSDRASFLVTAALQGAIDHGTAMPARALGFQGTAAGKTGTTDDYRDAWFVGYTPELLALVWVGFDDGESLGLTGSQAALPIWVDFMERSAAETSDAFPEPHGIVWEEIDPTTGGRSRWACRESRWIPFLEGTEPLERCDQHGWFRGPRDRRAVRSLVE